MVEMKFELRLKTPITEVFERMFSSPDYQTWTKAFSETSTMEGELKKGNEVFFRDAEGNGMRSLVSEYDLNKLIEFRYLGDVIEGEFKAYENRDNYERYEFSKIDEASTSIICSMLIPEDMEPMFDEMWQGGIKLLEELYGKVD